jgi:antitoxin (DNA-binding transcriptional repressor) of toxin-antitoxin stability system
MDNNMTMKRVNTHEVKANLSRFLEEVERGASILVCRRNVPIAELRPVASRPRGPRPLGLGRGRFRVPESFFEPLPQEIIGAFSGEPD